MNNDIINDRVVKIVDGREIETDSPSIEDVYRSLRSHGKLRNKVAAVIKHLSGKHDQSSHGNRNGSNIVTKKIGNATISLNQGDLTKVPVDAIVNAANDHLQHGGGLARAIVVRGGDSIQDESDQWIQENGNPSSTRPAITSAGSLPAKMIIHAVAPRWNEKQEPQMYEQLKSAYRSALDVAHQKNLKSISFPSLGTGIFGVPISVGAKASREAVEDFVRDNPDSSLKDIRFTIFDDKTVSVFESEYSK